MANKEKQLEAQKSRRNWIISISVLGAVLACALGGMVYYGLVITPQVNKAKDVASCKVFLVGYHDAQAAFTSEATAKDHKPSAATAVRNFFEVLHDAANLAYTKADPQGQIATGYLQISQTYLTSDLKTDSGIQEGFGNMDNAASVIENVCNTALDNAGVKSPVKTANPSPSK